MMVAIHKSNIMYVLRGRGSGHVRLGTPQVYIYAAQCDGRSWIALIAGLAELANLLSVLYIKSIHPDAAVTFPAVVGLQSIH